MSLPPELRVLCFQLSSTQTSDLPRLTPTLIRHVLRCQVPLSTPAAITGKADASASLVLVHKLKTQLSTLLNGKSSQGRFTAVVLIKAVVEIGGWEILRGSEAWVRGLLSVLGKPDSAATKEACILALTKIYCMTHQYQTLVREITTPTLPNFVTSCLNLISSKTSDKSPDVPTSLIETIFRSFATLLPHHTTIYRPFVSQIREAAKPYLAPVLSDGIVMSSSLVQSARRVVVALHQTVAKNAGGEEWGKTVRDLVKGIHLTADQVFRAVIEDWESTAGYISDSVDVTQELYGGARNAEDLTVWIGINAGVERLVGLLGMLEEYFRCESSAPVSIPLGAIVDMSIRILSIAIPSSQQPSPAHEGARLHPAIDRDERDGLWAGMPQIYIAVLQLIGTIIDRLQEGYLPLSQLTLDQLGWVFAYGKHDQFFRLCSYELSGKLLLQIGQTLSKSQATKYSGIIRSCCKDLQFVDPKVNKNGSHMEADQKKSNASISGAIQNAETFLQSSFAVPTEYILNNTDVIVAASNLLPLFISHFPQQHMDISLRSLIERTAIMSHSKDAMLSSILNPFVGKNGRAMTSILPHLTREFQNDDVVEILLRPRMPLLSTQSGRLSTEEGPSEEEEDEDMKMHTNTLDEVDEQAFRHFDAAIPQETSREQDGLRDYLSPPHNGFGTISSSDHITTSSTVWQPSTLTPKSTFSLELGGPLTHDPTPMGSTVDDQMDENLEDSDDESVHLTMQLDTESESEG